MNSCPCCGKRVDQEIITIQGKRFCYECTITLLPLEAAKALDVSLMSADASLKLWESAS